MHPSYSAKIDYLGKKFDVDYVVSPDHNGDDEYTVESIKHDGEEWSDFLECMHMWERPAYGMPVLRSALEVISDMVEAQHKEPEPEYDSTIVDGEQP